MSINISNKTKPCPNPVCRSRTTHLTHGCCSGSNDLYIICMDCGLGGPTVDDAINADLGPETRKGKAIDLWNVIARELEPPEKFTRGMFRGKRIELMNRVELMNALEAMSNLYVKSLGEKARQLS